MYGRLPAYAKVVVSMVIADAHDDDDDVMMNDIIMLNDGRPLSAMFVWWPNFGIFAVGFDVDHTDGWVSTTTKNKWKFRKSLSKNSYFGVEPKFYTLTSLCSPDNALIDECDGWSIGVSIVAAANCWWVDIDNGIRTFTVSSIISCCTKCDAGGMDVDWK